MKNLDVHILTRNNESTIESTLESAMTISPRKIMVGDIGSTDDTLKICKKYGAKIYQIPFGENYSDCRNFLLDQSKEWIFVLEPYEKIVYNQSCLENIERGSYTISVVQDSIISKELRLWHASGNLKFENPVYETVKSEGIPSGLIVKSNRQHRNEGHLKILENWKRNHPLSKEPVYYESYYHMEMGEYERFVQCAQEYLFFEENKMPGIMLRYHMACVLLQCMGRVQEAIQNVLICIGYKPCMSEFWCLLGDSYICLHQYEKAYEFYENACIIGRRRQEDKWPIEVAKYEEYPKFMMKRIEDTASQCIVK